MNEQQYRSQRTADGKARAAFRLAAELTDSDRAALAAFAAEHGRDWKAELRHRWENGTASPEMQHLRNCRYFGPRGLIKIRIADFHKFA